jgi:hypothetical protein
MSMKTTDKGIKKFSKEEKLAILEEGKRNDIKVTLAKYSLFPVTYYYCIRLSKYIFYNF